MSFIKNEYKPMLIILIFFLIGLFLYTGKMINPYIDFGDEISYPVSITKGYLLYRDSGVPFGPMSYIFNAFLLKFFSVNLTIYYVIGSLNAFIIVNLLYAISRFFLDKTFSLLIVLYVMGNCVFVPHVMNYITPYSYSIVYGLCSCLISLLLFLNCLKTDKNKFLSVSCLFAGVAAACKYEFLLYSVLLFIFIFCKNYKQFKTVTFWKTFFVCLFAFISVPVLNFLYLFFRGLTFADLQGYFINLKNFAGSQELHDLYSGSFYFQTDIFVITLGWFLLACFITFFTYQLVKLADKIPNGLQNLSYVLIFVLLLISGLKNQLIYSYFFCLLPLLITVMSLIKFKTIIKNSALSFLIATALVLSIKTYFCLVMHLYGRFFIPLLLVAFFALIFHIYSKENSALRKTFLIILIVLCAFRPLISFHSLKKINQKVSSHYGTFWAQEKDAYIFNNLINYFDAQNLENKAIATIPATGFINFLTGTDFGTSLDYNSLEFFQRTKPEYAVVITNNLRKDTCQGKSEKVCKWINSNYRAEKVLQKEDNLVLIFKKI